jgi:hypothetical protein
LQTIERGFSVIVDADDTFHLNANDWVYLAREKRHALRALEIARLFLQPTSTDRALRYFPRLPKHG